MKPEIRAKVQPIPKPVREVLNLKAGDTIAFELEKELIRLRKVRPIDLELARTLEPILGEWSGEADEEGYRDLRALRCGRRPFSIHRSAYKQTSAGPGAV